jgi:hypothetical protein
MKRIVLLLIALISAGAGPIPLCAQASAEMQASAAVSADTVTVGDPFHVVLRIRHAADAGVTPIGIAGDTDVEPLGEAWTIARSEPGETVLGRRLVLWRTDAPSAVQVPFELRTRDGGARRLTVAVPLPAVRSVLPADTAEHLPRAAKDIMPTVGPGGWARSLAWLLLLLVVVALALRQLRRRRAAPSGTEPGRAGESARDLLEAARGAPLRSEDWREFYSLVGTAIRLHAAQRSPEWTRDLTTWELEVRCGSRSDWLEVLHRADAVKFAGQRGDRRQAEADWGTAAAWIDDAAATVGRTEESPNVARQQ